MALKEFTASPENQKREPLMKMDAASKSAVASVSRGTFT
jgi:hypothetical protein